MTKFGIVVCASLFVLTIFACISMAVIAANYESIKEFVADVLQTIDMIKGRKESKSNGKSA